MNAGRPRPRRRLEREVHQCLPEDDGLRSAHGRGGPGSRPRRRPSRRCSKRRPLVVELGEVAGEGRILERPDPSSLASRRRAVGVGRSSVAADTRAAAGGGRRDGPGRTGSRGARSRTRTGAADERSSSEGRCRPIRDEPLGGRRRRPEPGLPVSVIIAARHWHRRVRPP